MNFIDLFAGAGGLSEGFIRAGFKPVAHVEMDEAACYTLQTRQAYHYLAKNNNKDIYRDYLRGEKSRAELYSYIPDEIKSQIVNLSIGPENNRKIYSTIDKQLNGEKVDLIIGGPPCQAYSLAGRARSKTKMEGDPRNHLYLEYAKYLERYTPKMFVFENVLGLLSAKGGFYFESMKKKFSSIGYDIKAFRVEANNFGVLQNRRRIIMIGWKKVLKNITIPDLEARRENVEYTVNDIFEDLPVIQAGGGSDKNGTYENVVNEYLKISGIRNGITELTQHIARPHSEQDKKIYKIAVQKWNRNEERLNYNDLPDVLKSHNNISSFTDRFKVVAGNKFFSQTVVAHIAKDGHYYIHPDIKQNRSITVREAARLQSFPDDFYFEGVKEGAGRTAAFKQIGNAVPPLMAEKIAQEIRTILYSF
jgi:DNA (cytosine-5)-methyltransferase 1